MEAKTLISSEMSEPKTLLKKINVVLRTQYPLKATLKTNQKVSLSDPFISVNLLLRGEEAPTRNHFITHPLTILNEPSDTLRC
jgi:hypothetical protein